jgi:carbonic anhydrase/acetyltransferase-like protein (isoleucine patch superfamily)
VSIGHNAIIHGCKIEDNVLIGMGAIIMDGALIQKNSIVAAGSVVTKNTLVTSGSIFAGLPAKLIRNISEEEIYDLTKNMADNYIKYSSWYL